MTPAALLFPLFIIGREGGVGAYQGRDEHQNVNAVSDAIYILPVCELGGWMRGSDATVVDGVECFVM